MSKGKTFVKFCSVLLFINLSNNVIIPPRTEEIVKIPVCYENGLDVLEYLDFGNNVDSTEAVVLIEKKVAITTVINPSSFKTTLIEPFEMEN